MGGLACMLHHGKKDMAATNVTLKERFSSQGVGEGASKQDT